MPTNLSLPQPPLIENDDSHQRYYYVPYDVLETNWLGDPRRIRSMVKREEAPHDKIPDGSTDEKNARYVPGVLVWVLLSKGKPKQPNNSARSGQDTLALHKKRRDKKNKRKNIDGDGHSQKEGAGGDKKLQSSGSDRNGAVSDETMMSNHSRKEFFLRARVISDDEVISEVGAADGQSSGKGSSQRRVLVRYSRGATYRVRAYNLIPVLEPIFHDTTFDQSLSTLTSQKNEQQAHTPTPSLSLPPLVVIVPETNIYRRVAKTHTTPDDSFMEIGCDYGITVDKIQTSLAEAGDVPKSQPDGDGNNDSGDGGTLDDQDGGGENNRVSCLGVDRSKESIDIANERYPKCKFALGNVLISNEMSSIRTICEQSLVGSAPSVICIDVNGNREIEGVLECLTMVINEQWKRQPRMIIVKSRFLYWEMKKDGGW